MIRVEGERVAVSGAMTIGEASRLLAEGAAAIAGPVRTVDLADVTDMDSSGLAVVFGWMRAANAAGKELMIANPPENLRNLAAVYGVAELLPQH